MKRKLFFATMFTGLTVFTFGQTTQMTNKNGLVITPEAGDWVLGMNAAPILNYVGNMFNGNTANSVGSAFVDGNNAIYGKYYVSADLAYRGSFTLTALSSSSRTLVDTNTIDAAPDYFENKTTNSGFGFYLSAGIEKRKGHNRLQGYYGAELVLQFGAATPNVSNEYGLALDSANLADGFVSNGRTLSSKAGSTFGVGARPFVGVEYFVLPKLSIGAEFGLGLMFTTTAGGETVTENFTTVSGGSSPILYERTTNTGKSNQFLWTTDNLGGAIRILYHF
ncbi:MAG: hypothetical protein KJ941_08450 [Bacteroidetes bacterium]|nr:hypothetical protein [Bacteroidota bacterium]